MAFTYIIDLLKEARKKDFLERKDITYASDLAVHFWGEKPKKLLERVRPREDPAIRDYRLEIWEPITVSKTDKSIAFLQSIFNKKLFSINWKEETNQERELHDYLTKDFPVWKDFIQYVAEILFKNMLADPNGVVTMIPTEFEVNQNERVKPEPLLFHSDQVLEYTSEWLYALKHPLEAGNDNILYYIDDSMVGVYEVLKDARKGYIVTPIKEYIHEMDEIPVWFLGGTLDAHKKPYIYKSFFDGAIAYWNKAIMADSDLDGAFINHIHPLRWEITEDCQHTIGNHRCRGGKIYNEKSKEDMTCSNCHGTGRISVKDPYSVYQINKEKLAEGSLQVPIGFINVPTDPVKLLDERTKQLISSGMSAIHMDIVDDTPLNQSGKAKEVDRDGLYRFMQQVSDFVYDNHVYNIIYFTNKYMFGIEMGSRVNDNLPEIVKPINFEVSTTSHITTEIQEAKKAKMSPSYIVSKTIELNDKLYATNEMVRRKLNAIVKLNPIPERDADEIGTLLMNGVITKEAAIVASNIEAFISLAINEDEGFLDLDYKEQMEVLKKYAQQIITGTLPTTQLVE